MWDAVLFLGGKKLSRPIPLFSNILIFFTGTKKKIQTALTNLDLKFPRTRKKKKVKNIYILYEYLRRIRPFWFCYGNEGHFVKSRKFALPIYNPRALRKKLSNLGLSRKCTECIDVSMHPQRFQYLCISFVIFALVFVAASMFYLHTNILFDAGWRTKKMMG